MDRQLLEAVIAHQLIAGLLGQCRLGTAVDYAGSDERFFHVMPATRLRVGVRPLVCDRGGAHQLRIHPGINLGRRINDFLLLVFVDDRGRNGLAVTIFEDELGLEIQAVRPGRGGGKSDGKSRNDSE